MYAACQLTENFQKQVALKLVKPSLASWQILRRFRMERQLLAALDHPNIGRLLDAGTSDEGAPYLVMEFVEGLPTDRYCETKNLTIGERLRLFLTVCDAVQYAHQNLIIHRDIKPSNILPDDGAAQRAPGAAHLRGTAAGFAGRRGSQGPEPDRLRVDAALYGIGSLLAGMARAYFESGDRQKAIHYEKRALELIVGDLSESALRAEFERNLRRFRSAPAAKRNQ